MVSSGFKPGAAEWKVKMNLLSNAPFTKGITWVPVNSGG